MNQKLQSEILLRMFDSDLDCAKKFAAAGLTALAREQLTKAAEKLSQIEALIFPPQPPPTIDI